MKLQALALAGIVSWLPTATLASPASEATAAVQRPESSAARGLEPSLQAGLGHLSFEDSASEVGSPLAAPAEPVPDASSWREPPGTPSVSPVPEPSALGLMLAGLAVLAVLLSRHRRRRG
ncbi:MAG: PEP-CTERM sorting domain-containing protein [Pseudomonadota bacterium]